MLVGASPRHVFIVAVLYMLHPPCEHIIQSIPDNISLAWMVCNVIATCRRYITLLIQEVIPISVHSCCTTSGNITLLILILLIQHVSRCYRARGCPVRSEANCEASTIRTRQQDADHCYLLQLTGILYTAVTADCIN